MDKNTVLGFLLIGALIFGFSWYNTPSEQERAELAHRQDSIRIVQEVERKAAELNATLADTIVKDTASARQIAANQYGSFAPAAIGVEEFYVVENNHLKMTFSNKGGQIVSVILKDYLTGIEKNGEKQPLCLFDRNLDGTGYFFQLKANDRVISTADMYFEKLETISDNKGNQILTFRLKTDTTAYIDYIYTVAADDYMVDFDVKAYQMDKVMPQNVNSLALQWNTKIRQQEKGRKFEDRYTMLSYKLGSDTEHLSEGADDEKEEKTNVKWIAFKDQFFNSILIADDAFLGAQFNSKIEQPESEYLKSYQANTSVAFDPAGEKPTGFRFYFGPNKYSTLKAYDKVTEGEQKLDLQSLVPLGWALFGWINRFVVIPIFNFFSSFIGNFGIIILLLTIVIKLVLFPLTYKSYLSTAKMRVLKPQIDEINQKIPATKPRERQQATMALYSKVGVNPMGGCLPMLLQMPILLALFNFFPASIELRQQSFLWAADLSSYDTVSWLTWNVQIPVISQYFGNHISIFCLLMTITNIVYTHINMQSTMESSQQIPGMKIMMYIMPVFFLFFFNDYASGLSYYYFIATLITILQTIIIRSFVDEEKLLKKLHENAKNPKKQKKSGFMARLEEAQRRQMEAQRQMAKKKK